MHQAFTIRTIVCNLSIAGLVGILACSAAVAEDGDKLTLADGDRRIATYNAGLVEYHDKAQPYYSRSGFIHPLYTPKGLVVTAPFSDTHAHQHGLMFAWREAKIDGRPVDFWNSKKQQGRIEHVQTVHAGADKIVVRLHHVDQTTKPETIALKETWEITRVPHPTLNVFDLVSTQVCVMKVPLVVCKFHYGGMCVRGTEAWLDNVKTVTSEGKDHEKGNHTQPNWVAMFGRIKGQPCGLAAMSHPSNFRGPQPSRLTGSPYFCFAPMFLGEFELQPDKPYVSRYRFVAYDGDPDADALNKLWKSFADDSPTRNK